MQSGRADQSSGRPADPATPAHPLATPNPPTPVFSFYSQLDLPSIRTELIKQEESIIFAFIERSQFRHNSLIYQAEKELAVSPPSAYAAPSWNGKISFFHYILYETECLHAKMRRYTSPDEHPFHSENSLPHPILPALNYGETIKNNSINLNSEILHFYLHDVIPRICLPGDDGNYGSTCILDVQTLQLLSKRIHYGKFVAEAKFRQKSADFVDAIRKRDTQRLMDLVTISVVEEQILKRVHAKAATYGTEPIIHHQEHGKENDDNSNGNNSENHRNNGQADISCGARYKLHPDVIASIYVQIMQLNKQVQIQYLLQRLDD